MTGYQTANSLFCHPLDSPSETLVGVATLAPNPALVIRDGLRVSLEDGAGSPVPDSTVDTSGQDLVTYRYNETFSTILGCESQVCELEKVCTDC